jgi:hypothetical protein
MMGQRPLFCCAAFILRVALCSRSSASKKAGKKPAESNVANFAGGCFWCMQEIFKQAPGITSVSWTRIQ